MQNKKIDRFPRQLVVLSGKGGTGKTSITSALAHLAKKSDNQVNSILADADVDAANLELVLNPTLKKQHEFIATFVAVIDKQSCSQCGICYDTCRFEAISKSKNSRYFVYEIDAASCEGCASCIYQCPVGAIQMQQQLSGYWYHSDTIYGPLFHASMLPGQENSGKLVTLVKQQARIAGIDGGYQLIIIDGPPGIGCPVISAASGADLSLIIAEPGVSGVHDMKRVLEVINHFRIPTSVCINKYDIHPEGSQIIENYCRQHGITVLGRIPFDRKITDAMVNGEIVTDIYPDCPASLAIQSVWKKLYDSLFPLVK